MNLALFLLQPPYKKLLVNNNNRNNNNTILLIEFESRAINRIIDAMANSKLTPTSPTYYSDETSLLFYADLFSANEYTETALYFEIGRILLHKINIKINKYENI